MNFYNLEDDISSTYHQYLKSIYEIMLVSQKFLSLDLDLIIVLIDLIHQDYTLDIIILNLLAHIFQISTFSNFYKFLIFHVNSILEFPQL